MLESHLIEPNDESLRGLRTSIFRRMLAIFKLAPGKAKAGYTAVPTARLQLDSRRHSRRLDEIRMLITVHVTPNAKRASVTKTGQASFEVRVDEKAIGGRANKRLIEILSAHLNVPKSRIVIVRGAKSRDKIIEVTQHRD